MNFLAHAFLSGDNDKIMVGNFIGDFVKGNKLDLLPGDIKKGVVLHRSIDGYTDKHPIVRLSKDRLTDKYRHYAGVIVDIFYDHFLAHNWSLYHPLPLKVFTERAYELVWSYQDILPDRAKRVVPYMQRDNWLLQYAEIEGIHAALSGMSRRTTFKSKMEQASEDLRRDYDTFKTDFEGFFPEVREFVAREIKRL